MSIPCGGWEPPAWFPRSSSLPRGATAAGDQRIEVKSAHFTITSDAGTALKQIDAAAGLADTDALAREAADLKAWIQRQHK